MKSAECFLNNNLLLYFDCLSNYCSKEDKLCTYPHMCERDQLQNCNNEQFT